MSVCVSPPALPRTPLPGPHLHGPPLRPSAPPPDRPKLAETDFGQSNFDQPSLADFGQTSPEGWGPEGWGPNGWGPEGWGPEGWGPEGWGGPKFLAFLSLSCRKFHSFFSLWGFSRGILVGALKCARLNEVAAKVTSPDGAADKMASEHLRISNLPLRQPLHVLRTRTTDDTQPSAGT